MNSARLSVAVALTAVLGLSACAKPGADYTSFNQARRLGVLYQNAPDFPDGSIVVFGIQAGPQDSVGVEIEQMEGPGSELLDKKHWTARGYCAPDSHDKCDGAGASYALFRMPPGKYAVVMATAKGRSFALSDYQSLHRRYQTSSRYGMSLAGFKIVGPRVVADTPVFVVNPGEVVYVGNFAFQKPGEAVPATAHLTLNEAAAREALADEGITAPMAVRPWTRPAGTAARPVRELK